MQKKKKSLNSIRKVRYVLYKETLVDLKEHFWTFIGSFFGIGLIAFTQSLSLDKISNIFLIGSFGASSVLIYGAIQSPLAQPRNLVGGHVISAFVGVCIFKLIPDPIWISAPLAVSFSIIAMQMTKTLHPPGGATALIAVIGTEKVKALGFIYVLSPVLSGVLILLLVALIANNLTKNRTYPTNSRLTKYIKPRKIRLRDVTNRKNL
ncbi:HPP family protein [Fluviicola chungangensis]|uniref:HPP family protein n=1 Tax=Fluviicola chungangensis TaxID=2597671 RepID=A0A556MQ34_9FLAO|nr:HPP family protein [Fluviicola chungangensis]TSJ41942.1 HPP family protein [Fluviicola chungangensis]